MSAVPPPQPESDDGPRVFVSYARTDEDEVETLVDGLRSFGADVWLDRALVGGHEWWQEILRRIRRCDVFVQAISAAGIESEACTRERAYARALGKPVLPVVVAAVDMAWLPDDLARLQVVRFIAPQPEDAFRLSRALASCPPAPPLPDPLPPPPEVPVSYLHGLRDKVRAPSLTLDDQLALVGRLEEALERADEREAALSLLKRLGERDDLYEVAARRIDRLTGAEPREPDRDVEPGPPPPPGPPAVRPAALAGSVLLAAAATGLVGGVVREVTRPDDGAGEAAEVLALALARTIGWAVVVAVVAAVSARAAGSGRPVTAAMRGLVAGAVAGLAGALVHGALTYGLDMASGTSRLVGLAVTGALAGAHLGRALRTRPAGFAGGLAGGLLAGLLVLDWPGAGASDVEGALSWSVHAVPACVGAVGLAALRRRQPAGRSEPVSAVTPVVKT